MLYYGKIDISKGIDVNKTSASKKYYICHYWYFLDKGFKFESYVCNKCHDVLIMPINLNNIADLNINGADYHCVIIVISISNYINLLRYLFD